MGVIDQPPVQYTSELTPFGTNRFKTVELFSKPTIQEFITKKNNNSESMPRMQSFKWLNDFKKNIDSKLTENDLSQFSDLQERKDLATFLNMFDSQPTLGSGLIGGGLK